MQWRVGFAHQGRLLLRDRQLAWLLGGVLLSAVVMLAVGIATERAMAREAAAAKAEEARVWAALPPGNPHAAAHFGRYAFREPGPLAPLDRGLSDALGVAVRLEGHQQNVATGRRIDGGGTLDGFARLDAAGVVALLGPLLLILAGFATFSGETVRALLRQEIAAGARPGATLAGRVAALVLLAPILAAPLAVAGALLDAGVVRVTLLAGGHLLYLLTFLLLTLAASAWFQTPRAALAVLLAFWASATLVLPRVAPALGEALHPTISAAAMEAAITDEVLGGGERDGQQARMERLKASLLARYKVDGVEQLPINFGGVAFFEGERLSAAIYARHMAAVHDGYAAQARTGRALAVLSPFLAIRPWSAALAETDMAAHRRMLEQAEAWRYRTVQALNRDIILHRPAAVDDYRANVHGITRGIEPTFTPEPLRDTLARQWPDLAVLLAWTGAAGGLLWLALRRRMARP